MDSSTKGVDLSAKEAVKLGWVGGSELLNRVEIAREKFYKA